MVDYLANVRVLMDTANTIKNTDAAGILNTVEDIYGLAFNIQEAWVGNDAAQYITELMNYQQFLLHLINFVGLVGNNLSDYALALQTNVQNNIQLQNTLLGAEGVVVEEVVASPAFVPITQITPNLSNKVPTIQEATISNIAVDTDSSVTPPPISSDPTTVETTVEMPNGETVTTTTVTLGENLAQASVPNPGGSGIGILTPKYNITPEQFDTICAVVQHEAGHNPEEVKNVMSAIMNRAEDGNWGGTNPYDVITEKGQFASYLDGYYQKYTDHHYDPSTAQIVEGYLKGELQPTHDFRSFRSSGSSSGVQLTAGGNKYR